MDTRRVDQWIERVQRGGFRAVLIGRLIPGLRVAMSLVAGTAHVPVPQFSAGVFVAGAIYWTGWVMMGASRRLRELPRVPVSSSASPETRTRYQR